MYTTVDVFQVQYSVTCPIQGGYMDEPVCPEIVIESVTVDGVDALEWIETQPADEQDDLLRVYNRIEQSLYE